MKKLSVLILALCMILSLCLFTACNDDSSADAQTNADGQTSVDGETDENGETKASGETDADDDDSQNGSVYQTVSAAITKTLGAKAYEANVGVLLKTTWLGNAMPDSSMNLNIKATGLDATPSILVDGSIVAEGYEMDNDMYYDGTWMYMSAYGDKYKSQASLDEFAEEIAAPQTLIVALPEALFAGVTGTTADGALTVTLSADSNTMKTLYNEDIVSLVYDISGEDLTNVTVNDATITLTVADGYVTDYAVTYKCVYEFGGQSVIYDVTRTVEFVELGDAVTVTPPADLDEYYELDWG